MPGFQTTKIGILTVSDRAAKGIYKDKGGPAVSAYLKEALASDWKLISRVVPDEKEVVEKTLIEFCDQEQCCLVITTGGTGPSSRDITPEVTTKVCEKILPGFGEAMRSTSLEKVPTAILSRQTAGIRGKSLIVNLPGSPKAIDECLDVIFSAIPDCLDVIGGPRLETNSSKVKAHRPH